ncbi:hypothetical protein [Pseudonocardia sp. DLS-67]
MSVRPAPSIVVRCSASATAGGSPIEVIVPPVTSTAVGADSRSERPSKTRTFVNSVLLLLIAEGPLSAVLVHALAAHHIPPAGRPGRRAASTDRLSIRPEPVPNHGSRTNP